MEAKDNFIERPCSYVQTSLPHPNPHPNPHPDPHPKTQNKQNQKTCLLKGQKLSCLQLSQLQDYWVSMRPLFQILVSFNLVNPRHQSAGFLLFFFLVKKTCVVSFLLFVCCLFCFGIRFLSGTFPAFTHQDNKPKVPDLYWHNKEQWTQVDFCPTHQNQPTKQTNWKKTATNNKHSPKTIKQKKQKTKQNKNCTGRISWSNQKPLCFHMGSFWTFTTILCSCWDRRWCLFGGQKRKEISGLECWCCLQQSWKQHAATNQKSYCWPSVDQKKQEKEKTTKDKRKKPQKKNNFFQSPTTKNWQQFFFAKNEKYKKMNKLPFSYSEHMIQEPVFLLWLLTWLLVSFLFSSQKKNKKAIKKNDPQQWHKNNKRLDWLFLGLFDTIFQEIWMEFCLRVAEVRQMKALFVWRAVLLEGWKFWAGLLVLVAVFVTVFCWFSTNHQQMTSTYAHINTQHINTQHLHFRARLFMEEQPLLSQSQEIHDLGSLKVKQMVTTNQLSSTTNQKQQQQTTSTTTKKREKLQQGLSRWSILSQCNSVGVTELTKLQLNQQQSAVLALFMNKSWLKAQILLLVSF